MDIPSMASRSQKHAEKRRNNGCYQRIGKFERHKAAQAHVELPKMPCLCLSELSCFLSTKCISPAKSDKFESNNLEKHSVT